MTAVTCPSMRLPFIPPSATFGEGRRANQSFLVLRPSALAPRPSPLGPLSLAQPPTVAPRPRCYDVPRVWRGPCRARGLATPRLCPTIAGGSLRCARRLALRAVLALL